MNQTTPSIPAPRSENIDLLAAALSKAQANLQDAPRTATNEFLGYDYADLTSVMATLREPMTANGLAVSQTFGTNAGETILITTLLHESGQHLSSFLPLLEVVDYHALGSAITYARKYSLAAILASCPAGADDDGEKAMNRAGKVVATRKPGSDQSAECRKIIESCPGADEFLRGKGIDPGKPPQNIREKILKLGAKGMSKKMQEQRDLEEADLIVEAAEKVEPIKEKEVA